MLLRPPESPPTATRSSCPALFRSAYALVDDLLPTLQRWCSAGRRYALSTLIEVVGSAPRPVGSEMAICENGEIAGYVSGGCVEAAVATEALASLHDGVPRMLDYGADRKSVV